jgi:DNA-binding response OmpR family regulator
MATILLANSDFKFSRILADVLARYRHDVVIARTGEEALQSFQTESPALVLLDLTILGLSGLDVLVKLRARASHLPIVVVTGDVPIEVENRAREMGVTDVLRKRLSMDVLMQAVNRALQEAGRPAKAKPTAGLSGNADGTKPATILLVDDEPEICEMVGEFLERRGYLVQAVTNGEDALNLVRKNPPDLVLLDIYMPGLNGVEVLRRLQTSHPAVGVIMLTASQEEPLLKTALALGAFDVLSKPVDLDQVEMAVMVKLMLNALD